MSITTLTWGVKASFRAYVEAAGGSIALSDGATRDDEGAFVFTALPSGDLAVGPDGALTGSVRFQGAVAFEAHGGMLKTTLCELAVEAGPEGAVISAPQAPGGEKRYPIAKLGAAQVAPDGALTLACTITLDGMYQIGDHYPPGTPLDPVRLG
jgi:Htaa